MLQKISATCQSHSESTQILLHSNCQYKNRKCMSLVLSQHDTLKKREKRKLPERSNTFAQNHHHHHPNFSVASTLTTFCNQAHNVVKVAGNLPLSHFLVSSDFGRSLAGGGWSSRRCWRVFFPLDSLKVRWNLVRWNFFSRIVKILLKF